MNVIAGDIGGTSSRLRLCQLEGTTIDDCYSRTYPSAEHRDFTDLISEFMNDAQITTSAVDAACFAVAGPVINGSVEVTNLPWFIHKGDIQQRLNNSRVALLNDFSANGYGVETLQAEDLHTLQSGLPDPNGLTAIVGAGTGLGVAYIIPDSESGKTRVFPTEAGHVDYYPVDDEQVELLKFMRRKLHRVSVERLLSGPGIFNIYKYARANPIYNQQENPELRRALYKTDDQAAEIVRYALEYGDSVSLRTLDIFIKVYGSAVGNIALSCLPRGGLYITGGIAPKLLNQLTDGRFMDRFLDKGRMSELLLEIPLHIVTNTHIGLQGAALYASRL